MPGHVANALSRLLEPRLVWTFGISCVPLDKFSYHMAHFTKLEMKLYSLVS